MTATDTRILLRIKSHNARQGLISFLGRRPQSWFSYDEKGHFYEITADELTRITARRKDPTARARWWASITVARAKFPDKLMKTWPSS